MIRIKLVIILKVFILVVIVTVTLASCGLSEQEFLSSPSDFGENPIIFVEPQGLLNARDSIGKLTLDSDLVVIARVIRLAEIINSARNPTNISEPDPELFGITQLYEIEVEKVLSGSGSPKLVAQYRGEIRGNWRSLSSEKITNISKNYSGEHLEAGKQYLMFLRKRSSTGSVYSEGTIFSATALPWVFDISDPERVTAVEVYADDSYTRLVDRHFPPVPLDDILKMIATPKDYLTPIPPSPTKTLTPEPTLNPTPYPPGFIENRETSVPTPYP